MVYFVFVTGAAVTVVVVMTKRLLSYGQMSGKVFTVVVAKFVVRTTEAPGVIVVVVVEVVVVVVVVDDVVEVIIVEVDAVDTMTGS